MTKENERDLITANKLLRERALALAERADDIERLHNAALTRINFWRNFSLPTEIWGAPNPTNTPPKEIPPEMMDGFTMNGLAEVIYNYGDSTYPDNWPAIYTDFQIEQFLKQIDRREYFIYGMTDVWMWEAIDKYPIAGLDVVNMGSLTPWYESNCLYFGARPTTIDYNRIISRTNRIQTMTVSEWENNRPRFDIAWSISSFEHDGLGMYGDPLDPDGDLKAMQHMKDVVKPGGLLFLSLPVGTDKVIFNNARIYGRHRLPLLMDGWEEIDTFGLQPEHLDGPGHIQPIFILRNT